MKFEKRLEKSKKLLGAGIVPGSIYGKNFESINIQIPEKDLTSLLQEYGMNSTFNASIDSKKHIVYFKELQRHFLDRKKIIHFSLHKLMKGDTLTAEVAINFVGQDDIIKKGLILQEIQNKLTVEVPIGTNIDPIELDISELTAENAIYVKDIKIPEEYKLHTDPELMVANAAYPKAEEEPETEVEDGDDDQEETAGDKSDEEQEDKPEEEKSE